MPAPAMAGTSGWNTPTMKSSTVAPALRTLLPPFAGETVFTLPSLETPGSFTSAS